MRQMAGAVPARTSHRRGVKGDGRGSRFPLGALAATALLWILVLIVAVGVRAACPVSAEGQEAAACQAGPIYAVLHPGPEAFNHAFGALVFLALVTLAIASSIYLAVRLARRGGH